MIEIVTSEMILEKQYKWSDYMKPIGTPEITTDDYNENEPMMTEHTKSYHCGNDVIEYKKDENGEWGESYSNIDKGWPEKDRDDMK